MTLADKLVLSARPGKISLFREGAFVRLYNHSLMRWWTVGQPLKVSVRPMRCLQGENCYSGGMPEAAWCARYRLRGVSLPGGTARVACWHEMLWGYEGDVDGLEPDWSAFCAEHVTILPAPVVLPSSDPPSTVDPDLLLQLSQWDAWQSPLAHTIRLLETCRQVLCAPGEAAAPIKPRH